MADEMIEDQVNQAVAHAIVHALAQVMEHAKESGASIFSRELAVLSLMEIQFTRTPDKLQTAARLRALADWLECGESNADAPKH